MRIIKRFLTICQAGPTNRKKRIVWRSYCTISNPGLVLTLIKNSESSSNVVHTRSAEVHALLINCLLKSDVISISRSNQEIQPRINARKIMFAVESGIGIASSQRVNRSIIVGEFLQLSVTGNGPTISMLI